MAATRVSRYSTRPLDAVGALIATAWALTKTVEARAAEFLRKHKMRKHKDVGHGEQHALNIRQLSLWPCAKR